MAEIFLKDDILVCTFEERVDAGNIEKLQTKIDHFLPGAKKAVFNIGKTNYISSVFLALALTVAKAVGNENFCIVNAKSSFVRDILNVSGFNKILNISVDDSALKPEE